MTLSLEAEALAIIGMFRHKHWRLAWVYAWKQIGILYALSQGCLTIEWD